MSFQKTPLCAFFLDIHDERLPEVRLQCGKTEHPMLGRYPAVFRQFDFRSLIHSKRGSEAPKIDGTLDVPYFFVKVKFSKNIDHLFSVSTSVTNATIEGAV